MTASDQASAKLAALLPSASVEISSRGHQIAGLRDNFAVGSDVTITFLPGDHYRHNIETATALRRAGFNPVPHIAAREMPSREALDDFLARARGEAAVSRILLIAGDVAAARGPFKSTRDVCASGLIEAHGIASVSLAGHPEGHPFLELGDALNGLKAWRDWGQRTSNPRRRRHAILLRERPDPAMDRRTRSCRHRPSRDRRPRRSGDAGDADQVCAPLRHRQFDAGAAQPDRPVRPAADGQRTGRCRQGIALRARGRNVCDRGISPVSVRRPAQGRRLAAQLRLRPRSVRRSAPRSHEPGLQNP